MLADEIKRFNNQSTDSLGTAVRNPTDFMVRCDASQLADITVSDYDGEFFQFGGDFNGRKTCYYLRYKICFRILEAPGAPKMGAEGSKIR